eukprot:618176-Rhodomonas_salina.2
MPSPLFFSSKLSCFPQTVTVLRRQASVYTTSSASAEDSAAVSKGVIALAGFHILWARGIDTSARHPLQL